MQYTLRYEKHVKNKSERERRNTCQYVRWFITNIITVTGSGWLFYRPLLSKNKIIKYTRLKLYQLFSWLRNLALYPVASECSKTKSWEEYLKIIGLKWQEYTQHHHLYCSHISNEECGSQVVNNQASYTGSLGKKCKHVGWCCDRKFTELLQSLSESTRLYVLPLHFSQFTIL